MATASETRIPCSTETRDLVREQKRAGENYDTVLQKMVDQYDPEKAAEGPEDKD